MRKRVGYGPRSTHFSLAAPTSNLTGSPTLRHLRVFWLSSGGLGTMGYGFPASLGAQIGRPDALVCAIVGDVETSRMKDVAERLLGAWKPQAKPLPQPKPAEAPPARSRARA